MQSFSLVIFAIAVVGVSLKIGAREATRMKQQMAEYNEGDPVTDALAWFDRVTSFHRS